MPIEFACECGKAFKVADEYAGKRSKCTACGQPVVVPSPSPPAVAEESAEDAAMRALLDGDDPEPAPRATSSFAGADDSPRRPAPPPPRDDAGSHAARALAAANVAPKPSKEKGKAKKSPARSSYDGPPDRRWSPNWLKVGGGALAILGAIVWFGLGWLAGRIYFYPIFLVFAGIFGIINGLLSRDGDA